MTGTLIRVSIILLAIYLVSSAHLKLNKRSATEGLYDGPCFTTNGEGPVVSRSLKDSMVDLKARTAGLKLDAQLLKDFLKEKYHISDDTAKQLDLIHWLNQEDMIIDEVVVQAAISQPSEAFKSHYDLLSVYGLYVEQLRTNGTFAEGKNEEETRKMLHSYEVELYSCLCSLRITIQSTGSEVRSEVSSDNLEQDFLANASPLTNATYRAYITMHDGISLMEFLNTIYKRVEASIMDATA